MKQAFIETVIRCIGLTLIAASFVYMVLYILNN